MDIREQIMNFPSQLQIGAQRAKGLKYSRSPKQIVIAGMGGSALAGRILTMVTSGVLLHEDYGLPANMTADALVICISWSGNTEETISAYQQAQERKLETVVITSGGQLAELAQKNATPLALLPNNGLQPRMAVGLITGALFEMLGLSEQLNGLSVDPLGSETQGQEIARNIGQRIPLIYATSRYQHLAHCWKILFNENCKIHAFANYFPALAHNEIAGFNQRDKNQFYYIALQDKTENSLQNRDLDSALAIIERIGYNGTNVNLSGLPANSSEGAKEGKTLLEKVFSNHIIGLWTSYYLAQALGVDPSDIEVIESFKKLKKLS